MQERDIPQIPEKRLPKIDSLNARNELVTNIDDYLGGTKNEDELHKWALGQLTTHEFMVDDVLIHNTFVTMLTLKMDTPENLPELGDHRKERLGALKDALTGKKPYSISFSMDEGPDLQDSPGH